MSEHSEYSRMTESVERHQNAKVDSDAAFFTGRALRKIYSDIGKALEAEDDGKGKAKMIARDGRKVDGSPETWIHVTSDGEDVGTTNSSSNCPPLPPKECEE